MKVDIVQCSALPVLTSPCCANCRWAGTLRSVEICQVPVCSQTCWSGNARVELEL